MSQDAPIDQSDFKVSNQSLRHRLWHATLVRLIPSLAATAMSAISLRHNIFAVPHHMRA